jgi:hypothetical protein
MERACSTVELADFRLTTLAPVRAVLEHDDLAAVGGVRLRLRQRELDGLRQRRGSLDALLIGFQARVAIALISLGIVRPVVPSPCGTTGGQPGEQHERFANIHRGPPMKTDRRHRRLVRACAPRIHGRVDLSIEISYLEIAIKYLKDECKDEPPRPLVCPVPRQRLRIAGGLFAQALGHEHERTHGNDRL